MVVLLPASDEKVMLVRRRNASGIVNRKVQRSCCSYSTQTWSGFAHSNRGVWIGTEGRNEECGTCCWQVVQLGLA